MKLLMSKQRVTFILRTRLVLRKSSIDGTRGIGCPCFIRTSVDPGKEVRDGEVQSDPGGGRAASPGTLGLRRQGRRPQTGPRACLAPLRPGARRAGAN